MNRPTLKKTRVCWVICSLVLKKQHFLGFQPAYSPGACKFTLDGARGRGATQAARELASLPSLSPYLIHPANLRHPAIRTERAAGRAELASWLMHPAILETPHTRAERLAS